MVDRKTIKKLNTMLAASACKLSIISNKCYKICTKEIMEYRVKGER